MRDVGCPTGLGPHCLHLLYPKIAEFTSERSQYNWPRKIEAILLTADSWDTHLDCLKRSEGMTSAD